MAWKCRLCSAASAWVVVVLCTGLTSFVDSQGIETIPAQAYVKSLAENVTLLCRSEKPAEDCRIKIPGYSQMFNIHSLPEGITYYGEGLPRGHCGITFAKIKSSNEGKFQCNMTIGGEVFPATIEIAIAIAPELTEIEIGEKTQFFHGGFQPNQTLSARCISEAGFPPANLTWYLDDVPIDDPNAVTQLEPKITLNKKGRNLTTVQQDLSYHLTTADHGKKIICKAEHFAIGRGSYRAFLPLNIMFAPESIPEVYIGDGTHAIVNATIRANPRPKTSWMINKVIIEEGHSVGPYQAYIPKDMGNGNYLVLLKINDHTNPTELFELTAKNELGEQGYQIKATKVPSDEPQTAGNSATFWLISIWTYFISVIVTCLL